jgi:CBS domain-containing protein
MDIFEIMVSGVVTCRPEDSLARVAGLMWDHDIGCLPVVDDSERVLGMITDRDVCMAAYTRGLALDDLRVAGAMARDVLACSPRQSLLEAENVMRLGRVRRAPVVDDDGRVIGIVSLSDLARESMREPSGRRPALGPDEVTATLATIAEPRQMSQRLA